MKKNSDDIKKPWLKANLKDIKNLINNQNFLVEDPEKDEPVTPNMDVYKAKMQSDGSLDKLKLRIVVGVDLHNKELVGDTWSPTSSMRTLTYLLVDATKQKAIFHRLYFIGALLQAKVKNRVYVNLDSRYTDCLPKYAKYVGRALILLKSMYGMTNYGKLFLVSQKNSYLKQLLSNMNVRCLSIISMHQMDQKLLYYPMLMTVYIGIHLRLLGNGFWIL